MSDMEKTELEAQYIISTIRDSVKVNFEIDDLDISYIARIVKKLPQELIQLGEKWGFDDTEVRDELWRFTRDSYNSIFKFNN